MNEVFLYGLSLPTSFSEARNSKPKPICKLGNKQVYLFYSIKDIDIDTIQSQDKIIFSKINSHVNTDLSSFCTRQAVQVSGECHRDIPESPIGSIIEMDIYYSNDIYSYENGGYLDESHIEELHKILNALQEDTGQSFAGSYSKRLGCFEYGHVKDWAEGPTPFTIRTDKKQPNKYYFTRTLDDEDMLVHLIVYSRSNEVLLDEFKLINQGVSEIMFSKELTGDGSFEYWVFNKSGGLLHRDKAHWLLSIGMTMSLAGASTAIDDKCSKRDDNAKHVKLFTPTAASEIDFSKDKFIDLIRSRENVIHELAKRFTKDKEEAKGKWFSRTDNAPSEIFNYLKKLTGKQNVELLIIDPFISRESLSPLLRLENTTITINIISCWDASDPDNGCSSTPKDDTKRGVVERLKHLHGHGLPVSRLTWYDLKKSKFHDRYVVVGNDKDRKVFMLSNSINSLLINYDFCIVLLEGLVEAKCLAYINTLLSECNEENKIWPETQNAR